jgi:hypothetical protein
VDQAQAVEQAMEMTDRWNKIFLRNLRALRDLRRYSPVVNIGTAAQMNVGARQLYVGSAAVEKEARPADHPDAGQQRGCRLPDPGSASGRRGSWRFPTPGHGGGTRPR